MFTNIVPNPIGSSSVGSYCFRIARKISVSNGVVVFRHGAPGEDRDAVDMTPRETRIDIGLFAGGAEATVSKRRSRGRAEALASQPAASRSAATRSQ